MRYLLDTNIFLRYVRGDRKLKNSVKEVLQDKNNRILISVISGVEISIKNKLGKLPLKTNLSRLFEVVDFELLNINWNHVLEFDRLHVDQKHKDPFDRLLIAQATAESLTLITADKKIWKYELPLLKA
ncbi:MAG: type II toxin-antitoxin system VapC family toxin [Patescibacteria group bacterium]